MAGAVEALTSALATTTAAGHAGSSTTSQTVGLAAPGQTPAEPPVDGGMS